MKIMLGITTYNRPEYLYYLLESFSKNANFKTYRWEVLIVDDFSEKKINTAYLKKFKKFKIKYIRNKQNMGVHYGTNVILKYFMKNNFDIGFKADDDIFFKRKKWDDLYINLISKTSYKHLTYYNTDWKPNYFKRSIKRSNLTLTSQSDVMNSLGCFWTFNREVVDSVGFFDVNNFGKRGYGHIDYSMRCCRAGFNNIRNFYHPENCDYYIGMQSRKDYIESMPYEEVKRLNGDDVVSKKIKIIRTDGRIYVK